MLHFIFDYNYGNFWLILRIFVPLETEINIIQADVYIMCYFNLSVFSSYRVKLKLAQKQPTAYSSVQSGYL